ncbi:Gfo/Idh/MocA family protein [Martelella soudanensis]|uniref:Gfo/Idh/MocA family protein n=1 Tax=unclassified Martelella TaxID=2629616 RepID=UPI0015DE0F48|nr:MULTISPECIES: Gfo/Idh/MocA family oxidoreductase [unclassified Martelella]
MTKQKVGIIGLGMVAQVIHLPVLKELGDHFEITALCDISPYLVEAIGTGFPEAQRYTDHHAMLREQQLDVVAVVNSDEYHADCAVDALAAGCHVLIEKPVCLTLPDLDRIRSARDASGRIAMVGYMRRFAGAYRSMLSDMPARDDIRHIAVRDIIGPNHYFLDQTERVISATDLTPAQMDERKARAAAQVAEALGSVGSAHVSAYRMLCGLGSHDLSALRGLVGSPKRVAGATQKSGGVFVSALLDYGSFAATFEMGVDKVGDFDAYIEIFAGDKRHRLDYDTPFIRHLPTTLTTKSTAGETLDTVIGRPTYRDPYTSQWLAFHQAIESGSALETSLEDAAEDLRLFAEIIAAFPD